MLIATLATVLALHAGAALPSAGTERAVEVQYRVPMHPPPCGNGWDLSARDGMCYPNGYLPPQEQAARQQYYRRGYGPGYGGGGYGYGRYPVPCGNGADVDIRDGRCYPTGTVPRRFQNRPENYYRPY